MSSGPFQSNDIKRRVSRKKKHARGMRRQRDIIDKLDIYYGGYRNQKEIDKFDVNYGLFNGRLDVSQYDDEICYNIGKEKVTIHRGEIAHYPLISQIANAMAGEILIRPFKPKAIHTGTSAKNLYKKKYNELISQMIEDSIVGPERLKIEQMFLQQLQSQDPSQVTPEMIQSIEDQIAIQTKAKTPEETVDFMENDFTTPTQKQAQQLLDHFLIRNNINEIQRDGFKHAIITGREFYYIGDRHGEPVMEFMNPKYFSYSASQNVEWVQDADWCKYEEWISVEKAMQDYAEILSKKDLKELDGFAEPIGGGQIGDYTKDSVMQETVKFISYNSDQLTDKYGSVDIKTKDGMSKMQHIYADAMQRYGSNYGTNHSSYGIRRCRFAWRDKRKMYRVTRITDGEYRRYWEAEHYESTHDDVKVEEIWVDEVWEGETLGSVDKIYVNIRPTPAQYKSIYTPFDVKLPYVGRCYNTLMNNAKNITPIDLGKPWQKEFDTLMAEIKHDMATDQGRVFLLFMNLKPDNMKWQDWMDTMKNSKLLLAQSQKHGNSGIDAQMMKSFDLSRTSDIAAKLQLADSMRANLTQAMFFNPARIGAIGQYSTNEVVQQNQSASYNQTEGFFETHRLIIEKALNMFMNRAKFLYRKQDHKLKQILDDSSRMDLLLGADFWYEEMNIRFSTTSEDIRRVEALRSNMLTFTQNGMGFSGVLGLMMADTPAEIADIMKKEEKKIAENQQLAFEREQQSLAAKAQADAAEKKADRDAKAALKREELESQERRTAIQVESFKLAADIDNDLVSDSVQREIVKQEFESRRDESKLSLDREKLELEKEKLRQEFKRKVNV